MSATTDLPGRPDSLAHVGRDERAAGDGPAGLPDIPVRLVDGVRHIDVDALLERGWDIEPFFTGPSWEPNPDWDGIDPVHKYRLPEFTLGWEIIDWVGKNCTMPDEMDAFGNRKPFRFTPEQARFILWWYAIDETGRFLFRSGVLQRLKGWGKDPLVAVICVVEMLGPCRFAGWAAADMPHRGLRRGDPVGKVVPNAWIDVAAVTREQTKTTMTLFSGLISEECKRANHMGKANFTGARITAHGGQRQIRGVTKNPAALEGGRNTFTVLNEALALDTPIPTPTGWTTMGALRDGDVIFADDGQQTIVTKAHDVQHGRRCFKVTFGEGDSVITSDGHLWHSRVAHNPRCTMKRRTTLEMYEAGRPFWIDALQGIDGPEADLPIDPYIMGLWLGDGSSRNAQIACDPRDIDEIAAEMTRLGVKKAAVTGVRGMHLTLADTTRGGRQSDYKGKSIQSRLRQMGLLQNKHIPQEYLRASRQQRIALLQGLMDSDGSIRKNGNARFTNTNPRLIDGCRELLLSLGYACRPAAWQTWPNEKWKNMGVICFVAYEEVPPFRLSRKAKRMRKGSIPLRSRSIVKIEEVESVPVRCISVSSTGQATARRHADLAEAIEDYYSGHDETRKFLCGTGFHATMQTHHWVESNNGIAMAAVLERNTTKSKGGAARRLSITNAFNPSQSSVAQAQRSAWEAERDGLAFDTGFLYDSLEVPKQYGLRPPELEPKVLAQLDIAAPSAEDEKRIVLAYIFACLDVARGDAHWLDKDTISKSILSTEGSVADAKRFWFNQTEAPEDVWIEERCLLAAVDPLAEGSRKRMGDKLRAGWAQVGPDEPVVLFGDGSKSDDATALVGCRLSDGYVFTVGVWQRPPGLDRDTRWVVNRADVTLRVREAMERFNVVAFWFDPSHTTEDVDDSRFWDSVLDDWHTEFSARLDEKFWAVKTGQGTHSISWDMASHERQKAFVTHVMRTREELRHGIDEEGYGDPRPLFKLDGFPALMNHFRNAMRHPISLLGGFYGISIRKEGRESLKKIDLAVCAIGARMLRQIVLNVGREEKKPDEAPKTGMIWAD